MVSSPQFRRPLRCAFIVVALSIASFVDSLAAQDGPQDPPVTTPAQPPAAAPPAKPPSRWKAGTMFGLTHQSGVTDAVSVTVSGFVARPSTPEVMEWAYLFEADYVFSQVKIVDTNHTVADSQYFRFMAHRDLTPRVYLIVRPSFTRNTVQSVDYRFEELVGVGFRVVTWKEPAKARSFNLSVVPVIGAVQQEKHLDAIDGATGTVGVFQGAEYGINQAWSLSQIFLYLQDFNEGDDYRVQIISELRGAITRHLGVSLKYTLDRQNVVLDASEKADQRTSVGLTFSF